MAKRKSAPKSEPEPVAEEISSSSEESQEEEEEEEESDSSSSSEESEEEKEESGEEDEESDEEQNPAADKEGSRREMVKKLLEPFGKDQLIEILKQAAIKDSEVLERINKVADRDPSHRKVFVHGLGWDATNDALMETFKKYGSIEDCNVITDKITGKSKGYGFVVFQSRAGARKALKQPQKKIGNRMTASQLASFGPVPNHPVPDATGRKIYVSGIGANVDIEKLSVFLSKYGDLEEGPPLGLDKATGKHKGFAIFVYKAPESAKKALEEPFKTFEGCQLHCKRALDGLKSNKPVTGALGSGVLQPNDLALTSPSLMALPFNQGISSLSPGLGQTVNPLLVGQSATGLAHLNPLGSSFSTTGFSPSVNQSVTGSYGSTATYGAGFGGYGGQAGINSISSSVIGSYGSQAALQGLNAYQNAQFGQSSSTKSPAPVGSLGALSSYMGR